MNINDLLLGTGNNTRRLASEKVEGKETNTEFAIGKVKSESKMNGLSAELEETPTESGLEAAKIIPTKFKNSLEGKTEIPSEEIKSLFLNVVKSSKIIASGLNDSPNVSKDNKLLAKLKQNLDNLKNFLSGNNEDSSDAIIKKLEEVKTALDEFINHIDDKETKLDKDIESKKLYLDMTVEFFQLKNEIINAADTKENLVASGVLKEIAVGDKLISNLGMALSNDVIEENKISIFSSEMNNENNGDANDNLNAAKFEGTEFFSENVELIKDAELEVQSIETTSNTESHLISDDVSTAVSDVMSLNLHKKDLKAHNQSVNDLRDRINEKIENIQKLIVSKDKLLIQINPKNLGSVELFFKKTNDSIEMVVEVEKKESKEQMEQVLDEVKRDFRERNIELNIVFKEKEKEKNKEDNERKNEYREEERNNKSVDETFEEMIVNVMR